MHKHTGRDLQQACYARADKHTVQHTIEGDTEGGGKEGEPPSDLGAEIPKSAGAFVTSPRIRCKRKKIKRQERGGGGVGLVNVPVAPALKWIPSVVQSRRRLSDGLSHFFLQVSGHRHRSVSTARSSVEHPPSTSFTQHRLLSDSRLIAPPASSRSASEGREEPRSLCCLSSYSIL